MERTIWSRKWVLWLINIDSVIECVVGWRAIYDPGISGNLSLFVPRIKHCLERDEGCITTQ